MDEELLTRDEAYELMMKCRARISALQKLDLARTRQWESEHPEITALQDRLAELHERLEIESPDGPHPEYYGRTFSPEHDRIAAQFVSVSDALCAELDRVGGRPRTLLTQSEQAEIFEARSQAQQLLHNLTRVYGKRQLSKGGQGQSHRGG